MKSLFFRSLFVVMTIFSTHLYADVGGVVFEDLPNQVYGVKESNEVGVANFEVLITNAQGNSQTIITDSNGMWSSTLSAPVRVEFKNCDSCANPTQFDIDSKGSVVLVDEDRDDINFGVYPKGSYKNSANGDKEPIEVGNLVWDDSDGDGLQSAGEKGIAGVYVELYCNGELVDTAKTDQDGYYLFSTDKGKNNTDSLRYDLGDYLKENNSNNCKIVIGEQDALDNVVPTDSFKGDNPLLDSNGELVGDSVEIKIPNTLKAGKYDYDLDVGFKPCNVCIGDFVWNDANKNGIQDNGEKGIKGVFVTLLNEDGSVNNTVQTDKDGKYKFCELFNGEKYKVQVQLPDTSYEFSPKNQGDDTEKDSNIGSDGKSAWITIGTENNYSIDAGMYVAHPIIDGGTHCIGSVYWYDKNLNKVLDSGDIRMGGMKVWLYDGNKNLIKSTTTNDNGEYKFCGLSDGNYYVKFELPDGYLFLPKNQGSDSNADSDANSNGWSDLITVNGGNVNHIDAGIYCSCSEGEVKNWEKLKASFSEYVVVIFILLLISVTFRNNLGKER